MQAKMLFYPGKTVGILDAKDISLLAKLIHDKKLLQQVLDKDRDVTNGK